MVVLFHHPQHIMYQETNKGEDSMNELMREYISISNRLTVKQNQLIKCKSSKEYEQLQADIQILELLYQDVSYKLDRLYI